MEAIKALDISNKLDLIEVFSNTHPQSKKHAQKIQRNIEDMQRRFEMILNGRRSYQRSNLKELFGTGKVVQFNISKKNLKGKDV